MSQSIIDLKLDCLHCLWSYRLLVLCLVQLDSGALTLIWRLGGCCGSGIYGST